MVLSPILQGATVAGMIPVSLYKRPGVLLLRFLLLGATTLVLMTRQRLWPFLLPWEPLFQRGFDCFGVGFPGICLPDASAKLGLIQGRASRVYSDRGSDRRATEAIRRDNVAVRARNVSPPSTDLHLDGRPSEHEHMSLQLPQRRPRMDESLIGHLRPF